jgi:hypothetical protein
VKRLFDIGFWARALRNPIVLAGLALDLAPMYGVVMWGWTATPLVLLYWTENVVIGVMTLPRILISGANFGIPGLLGGLFMCAFFTFHYGLFCMVHGIFLVALSSMGSAMHGGSADGISHVGLAMDNPLTAVPDIVGLALKSGEHLDWMLYAIIGWQVIVFFWEFILKGGWKTTNPGGEMGAPYGRIIILHFGIFAGFGALMLLGQPMVGVLGLILFRAVLGVLTNDKIGKPDADVPAMEAQTSKAFADAMSQIQRKPPA